MSTTPEQRAEWKADAERTVGMSRHPTPARLKSEAVLALIEDVEELTRQRAHADAIQGKIENLCREIHDDDDSGDPFFVLVRDTLDDLWGRVEKAEQDRDVNESCRAAEFEAHMRTLDRAKAAEAALAGVTVLHSGLHQCTGGSYYDPESSTRSKIAVKGPCPTLAAIRGEGE